MNMNTCEHQMYLGSMCSYLQISVCIRPQVSGVRYALADGQEAVAEASLVVVGVGARANADLFKGEHAHVFVSSVCVCGCCQQECLHLLHVVQGAGGHPSKQAW